MTVESKSPLEQVHHSILSLLELSTNVSALIAAKVNESNNTGDQTAIIANQRAYINNAAQLLIPLGRFTYLVNNNNTESLLLHAGTTSDIFSSIKAKTNDEHLIVIINDALYNLQCMIKNLMIMLPLPEEKIA